jgi:GNAT superfamily N-acetyltransferase
MEAARPARPGDVERLVQLWSLAVDELSVQRGGRLLVGLLHRPDPAASFAAEMDDPRRHLIVGDLHGVTLGFGSARLVDLPGERVGMIDELYVEPPGRGIGLGHAMAEQLMTWCRVKGCTGVDGLALPGNRATKSFFEGQGFTARLLVMHHAFDLPDAPAAWGVAADG